MCFVFKFKFRNPIKDIDQFALSYFKRISNASASMSGTTMTSLASEKLPLSIVANTELLLARTYLCAFTFFSVVPTLKMTSQYNCFLNIYSLHRRTFFPACQFSLLCIVILLQKIKILFQRHFHM